jgi:hypothetical protein
MRAFCLWAVACVVILMFNHGAHYKDDEDE